MGVPCWKAVRKTSHLAVSVSTVRKSGEDIYLQPVPIVSLSRILDSIRFPNALQAHQILTFLDLTVAVILDIRLIVSITPFSRGHP